MLTAAQSDNLLQICKHLYLAKWSFMMTASFMSPLVVLIESKTSYSVLLMTPDQLDVKNYKL